MQIISVISLDVIGALVAVPQFRKYLHVLHLRATKDTLYSENTSALALEAEASRFGIHIKSCMHILKMHGCAYRKKEQKNRCRRH